MELMRDLIAAVMILVMILITLAIPALVIMAMV